MCSKCTFVSYFYKLYEEVESKCKCRRSAKVNGGLQLGLMSTTMSNTGACRLLANTNIIPPSRNGMSKMSDKVGEAVINLNNESLKQIKQKLVEENKLCGNKDARSVHIEGDSCYNNPMFNSDSTPFQAGTIVTSTFCENNTRNKNSWCFCGQ